MESFRTDSLDLAAYLVECGYNVRKFDWETLTHGCLIVFEETAEEVDLELRRWNMGDALVNAPSFANNIKLMKRDLMASKRVSA